MFREYKISDEVCTGWVKGSKADILKLPMTYKHLKVCYKSILKNYQH